MLRQSIGLSMRLYRASPCYPWCGTGLARLLSWVAPRRAVLADINGVKFELDLREVIDSSLYYSGSFEPPVEKIIAEIVRPGGIAIDVGANVGYHTFALAKRVGPTGRVVAVEPTSYAFDRLRRNLAFNDFPNVQLVKTGLSDRDEGEVEARFQSSYRLDGRDEIRCEKVRVLTLDTLVQEQGLPRVDFIKMDVDGYEAKVFAGARRTLERFHPPVLFEFGPELIRGYGGAPEAPLQLLWDLGYRLSTENGRDTPDAESVFRSVQAGRGVINLLATPGPA